MTPTRTPTSEMGFRPAGHDQDRLLRRLAVEEFLYAEAMLLDEWRLDDWLELFTEDGHYVVPATDLPDGDPKSTLPLIDDDKRRLWGRVERLKSAKAYREFPWSRTNRLVTNVRILEPATAALEDLHVLVSFVAFRFRNGAEQTFVGTMRYLLVEDPDAPFGFRIRHKRVELGEEALRPHGTLSIIL